MGKRSVPGESSTSSHVRHCTVRSERLQPDFSKRLRTLLEERKHISLVEERVPLFQPRGVSREGSSAQLE